jgi:hypothetical protein
MPPAYATEVQTVINALNELNQPKVEWDCGTTGVGVMVSDSLMFERGEPQSSDAHLSHIYGLALPLLKRGIPVTPVQLENLPISGCLDQFRLLLMTYQGMKPLTPEAHQPLARWVRAGGVLVFCDDDSDPYNRVREWWNSGGLNYGTPRAHLFAELGVGRAAKAGRYQVGKGVLVFRAANPASLAADPAGDTTLVAAIQEAIKSSRVKWRQTNYLLLRRGKYVIAAGLDESAPVEPKVLRGRFLNLFDPELAVQAQFTLAPGNRFFLLDLDRVSGAGPHLLASACKALVLPPGPPNPDKVSVPTGAFRCVVEGVARTEAVVLLRLPRRPRWVSLAGQPLASLPEPDAHSPAPRRAPQGLGPADNRADTPGRRGSWSYDAAARLLWIKFPNEPRPRELATGF